MTYHVLAVISSHGFGHFAMTAPVLNHLAEHCSVRLTIRSSLPLKLIQSRMQVNFDFISESSDFGMCMNSSIDVDIEASFHAYRELHAKWQTRVQEEMHMLQQLSPDLVFSNIPYLTLQAAANLDVPAIAMCSLNWFDIYKAYFGAEGETHKQILMHMQAAYNSAHSFLCPEPAMSMPAFDNVVAIGPIAEVRASQADAIKSRMGIATSTRLVLISPGGVATQIPVERWPIVEGIVWLTSWSLQTKHQRDDIKHYEDTGCSFTELLASCDAVITKPGYGIVTESACNAVPALFVRRGDWAEEDCLIHWWQQNNRIVEIPRDAFFNGQLIPALERLWQLTPTAVPNPSGIEQASRYISQILIQTT